MVRAGIDKLENSGFWNVVSLLAALASQPLGNANSRIAKKEALEFQKLGFFLFAESWTSFTYNFSKLYV